MYRTQYYRKMKNLAAEVRTLHDVETGTFGLLMMRKIYRAESIRIDMQTLTGRKIRAAYFYDGVDASVLLRRGLPEIPRLFSLGHELKHHYCDKENMVNGQIQCGDFNANEMIEIGAEIFSAELIYPEAEFLSLASKLRLGSSNCTIESIIGFKRVCPAKISYKFLLKRLEWFEFISIGQYSKVHFQKREEEIFGLPIYKQDWFIQRRSQNRSRNRMSRG